MAASSAEGDTDPRVRTTANTVVRGCWTIGMNTCGDVSRSTPSCLTSPTTPTMVRHGPNGSVGKPCLSCFPTGSSFGQYFLATVLLTMATGSESIESERLKYRPLISGILSVSKNPAVTGAMPAFGNSPTDIQCSLVLPGKLNTFHQFEPSVGSE